MMSGYKTYIVGTAMFGWGVIGWMAGIHDEATMSMLIGNGLGMMGLRNALR